MSIISNNSNMSFKMTNGNVEVAATFETDRIDFIVTEENRSKIGFINGMTDMIIPSTFIDTDGKNYKVIGIGNRAFNGCTSLRSVNIPNSVTTIGERAFYYCTSLLSINISNYVTRIGNIAFYNCESLTSFNVDPNNPNYKSIDGVLFSKDGTKLIQYPAGNARVTYTIPNIVTIIDVCSFSGCRKLATINITSKITIIPEGTFFNSIALTSINIPTSVTTIGDSAFYACTALVSINIPSNINIIGNYVFQACTKLTSININKPSGSISGSPWNCPNPNAVKWLR